LIEIIIFYIYTFNKQYINSKIQYNPNCLYLIYKGVYIMRKISFLLTLALVFSMIAPISAFASVSQLETGNQWGDVGLGSNSIDTPEVSDIKVNNSGSTNLSGDKDCANFGSQSEAQSHFDSGVSKTGNKNFNNLDGDGDNKACESLPKVAPSNEPKSTTIDLDQDCSDFEGVWSAASTYFNFGKKETGNKNFDNLDGDGDGIPCEALKSKTSSESETSDESTTRNASATTNVDKDCSDFNGSHKKAQTYFDGNKGDEKNFDNLDGNRDGIACNALLPETKDDKGMDAMKKAAAWQDDHNKIRYQMGGNTIPKAGGQNGVLDCSSFTQWMYKEYLGKDIPRTTYTQEALVSQGKATRVSKNELQEGDLILMDNGKDRLGHVGIYLGDGQMVHNSSGAKKPQVVDLDEYLSSYMNFTTAVRPK
jgi:hypothetical protein